jgi:hypothetical protein
MFAYILMDLQYRLLKYGKCWIADFGWSRWLIVHRLSPISLLEGHHFCVTAGLFISVFHCIDNASSAVYESPLASLYDLQKSWTISYTIRFLVFLFILGTSSF